MKKEQCSFCKTQKENVYIPVTLEESVKHIFKDKVPTHICLKCFWKYEQFRAGELDIDICNNSKGGAHIFTRMKTLKKMLGQKNTQNKEKILKEIEKHKEMWLESYGYWTAK